jgi:hypothetical protein
MKLPPLLLASGLLGLAPPAHSSTPEAWAALNRAVNRACLSMVDGRNKKIVGETASFADTVPVELRIVEATTRRGVKEVKLCAYDRAKRRAAITDATGRLGLNRR